MMHPERTPVERDPDFAARIVKQYFAALNNNDFETLVALFEVDAHVFPSSSNYTPQNPRDFYTRVFDLTERKDITLHTIATNPRDPNRVIVHFGYKWTQVDGTRKNFPHAFDEFVIDPTSSKIRSITINLGCDTFEVAPPAQHVSWSRTYESLLEKTRELPTFPEVGALFPWGTKAFATALQNGCKAVSDLAPASGGRVSAAVIGYLEPRLDAMVRSVVTEVVCEALALDVEECVDDLILISEIQRSNQIIDEFDIRNRLELSFKRTFPERLRPFSEGADREDNAVQTFGELVEWVKCWLRSPLEV